MFVYRVVIVCLFTGKRLELEGQSSRTGLFPPVLSLLQSTNSRKRWRNSNNTPILTWLTPTDSRPCPPTTLLTPPCHNTSPSRCTPLPLRHTSHLLSHRQPAKRHPVTTWTTSRNKLICFIEFLNLDFYIYRTIIFSQSER